VTKVPFTQACYGSFHLTTSVIARYIAGRCNNSICLAKLLCVKAQRTAHTLLPETSDRMNGCEEEIRCTQFIEKNQQQH